MRVFFLGILFIKKSISKHAPEIFMDTNKAWNSKTVFKKIRSISMKMIFLK